MAYCCKCGNGVGDSDQYCAKCGAQQPGTRKASDFASAFSPKTASVLCYLPGVGWIAAIVVLASTTFRNDRTVRFHAFQGLYLFVAWLIADQVLVPMFGMIPHLHIGGIFQVLVLVMWVFMIVKASHEEAYSLPIIGELAERSVAER